MKVRRGLTREQKLMAVLFLAPALLLFTTLVAVPSVNAFMYSLKRWDGLGDADWAGLRNFVRLFEGHSLFLAALRHNAFLMVVPPLLTLSLALYFASLLRRNIPGARLFRVTFFFPNVMSAVAVSLLWILIYSTTDFGIINGFLRWLGYEPFAFTQSSYLLYAIVPMMVWGGTGFYMVLFLAAMQNIPDSMYDAARIDGASNWRMFRDVTFPLIRDVFTIGLVFAVIAALKIFDAIWVMENMRPKRESHVIATLMYSRVFSEFNVGQGCAIAVVLFLLVLVATLIIFTLRRGERIEY